MLFYHFDRVRLLGLSTTAVGAYCWDAVSTTGRLQPNQTEVDLYLDYKIPMGAFKDLWFRVQRAREWNVGAGQTTQWRAIVYWETTVALSR